MIVSHLCISYTEWSFIQQCHDSQEIGRHDRTQQMKQNPDRALKQPRVGLRIWFQVNFTRLHLISKTNQVSVWHRTPNLIVP